MLDAAITAMNAQTVTSKWIDELSENLMNVYTPGYQAKKMQFKTFLEGSIGDRYTDVRTQGKSIPGYADENLFMEGKGYFVLRNAEGRISYTRLGDFKFDGEGMYRSKDGSIVQGYLVNEKGELMNGVNAADASALEGKDFASAQVPLTNIKLWIDPSNGFYLGKYDEFEVKEDGILYGKADKGAVCTPLYKIAAVNFSSPENLFQIQDGQYIETEDSGRAVIGNGKIRGKLLEQSNVNFNDMNVLYQQAQFQLSIADMITKSNRNLLQQVMGLMGQ